MIEKHQYPKEQIEFLQAVLDMREAQKQYFNQPGQYRLKVALSKEQKVDRLLQPYLQAGVINEKPRITDNSKPLF